MLTLSEGGATALGPALYTSILLAGQGGNGSKVILCTDGLANIGLGNLEANSRAFYPEITEKAQ